MLAGDRIEALRQQSLTPAEAGLTLEQDAQGLHLNPVRGVVRRGPAGLPFWSRQFAVLAEPVVSVSVNGRTALALLDSGSALSLIDWRGALRTETAVLRRPGPAGPAPRPKAGELIVLPGHGLGAPFTQFLGLARDFRAGGVCVSNLPVGVLNTEAGIGRTGYVDGRRVEMLMGADVLSLFDRVTLDFPRERAWIDPAPENAPVVAGRTGVAPLLAVTPIPVIQAELAGYGPIPIGLDSGGGFGLWMPCRMALALKLKIPENPGALNVGLGIGGDTLSVTIGNHVLKLDGLTMSRVPVVAGVEDRGGEEPSFALLGRAVMNDYAVTIDYKAKSVRFVRASQ